LCGARLDIPEDVPTIDIPVAAELPEKFDWRYNDGNWMTPVKDQANCGSCWDFGAVGQVEAWWKIFNNRPDTLLDLSEQFILSCSGAGTCNGGNPILALQFIKDFGIPKESCFRYRAQDLPCDQACSDWQSQSITIPGYALISNDPPSVGILKSAILQQPVAVVYTVYEDFTAYQSGVYEHVSGQALDGHAVVIVGWDDSLECWIVKNSWSSQWGENGYFRIKWGDIDFGGIPTFIWETSDNAEFKASIDTIRVEMEMGESHTESFYIKNEAGHENSFFVNALESPVTFHPAGFNAYDDQSWWCGTYEAGGYENMWLQYLDTPMIDLSTATAPTLTFQTYWALEDIIDSAPPEGYNGWDGCNVWISSDGGDSFQVIQPLQPEYNASSLFSFGHEEMGWNMGPDIPGWIGFSGGWKQAVIDLNDYKSDSVVIRFAFASDPGFCSTDDETVIGFFVDEILLTDGEQMIFEDHGDNATGMMRQGLGQQTADWISNSASNTSIAAGDSVQIDLDIVARDVHPGLHRGQLTIVKNDTMPDLMGPFFSVNIHPPEQELWLLAPYARRLTLPLLVDAQWDVIVGNLGRESESCEVTCEIMEDDSIYYRGKRQVENIQSMQSKKVTFSGYVPMEKGSVTMKLSLDQNSDFDPDNNTGELKVFGNAVIDDFEHENTYWTCEGGWERIPTSLARSGNFAAHCNGGDRYEDNMDATLTFTPGIHCQRLQSLTLYYQADCRTRDGDVCYLEVSTDSTTWIKVDSLSGRHAMDRYQVELMDFVEFGSSKVWFRFHFISNDSETLSGVVIDDIRINPRSFPVEVETAETLPLTWGLEPNYPNPFNNSTTLTFRMRHAAEVNLVIYNSRGQRVCTLVGEKRDAGLHKVVWDGRDERGQIVSSGLYFCCFEVGDLYRETRKVMLLK